MGKVSLWGIEFRVQGAGCRWGARRVSNAVGIRRIVRKHDCALPAQYNKHSNARGVSMGPGLALGLGLGLALGLAIGLWLGLGLGLGLGSGLGLGLG